ncbi:unnamed protein product [Rotaria sordida]|uniref:Uncharacterized protein n=1 Tax=Rotaria sordida TaxID=392033 RepID=A0A814UI29_9BILA|nr:unnamed protein product [Rotaria sordida]CAF1214333.1 unnamed protein product [Rotaria sordida]
MVKRKSNNNAQRYIVEYRMRTGYAIPVHMNQFNSDKQNTTRSPRLNAAHDRSHANQNSTAASYHYDGRIDKNKRIKKSPQQQNQFETTNNNSNNINNQRTVPITTTKKSSCCTIL